MTLRSIHNPEFAHFDDVQLGAAFLAAESQRKTLIATADAGADVGAALDEIDSLIFRLDDELCARNLPLPR